MVAVEVLGAATGSYSMIATVTQEAAFAPRSTRHVIARAYRPLSSAADNSG